MLMLMNKVKEILQLVSVFFDSLGTTTRMESVQYIIYITFTSLRYSLINHLFDIFMLTRIIYA